MQQQLSRINPVDLFSQHVVAVQSRGLRVLYCCSRFTGHQQDDRLEWGEAPGAILSTASGLIISTSLLVVATLLKVLFRKSSQSWCFVLNLALADVLVGVATTSLATEDFNSDVLLQRSYRNISAAPPLNAAPTAQGETWCGWRSWPWKDPCWLCGSVPSSCDLIYCIGVCVCLDNRRFHVSQESSMAPKLHCVLCSKHYLKFFYPSKWLENTFYFYCSAHDFHLFITKTTWNQNVICSWTHTNLKRSCGAQNASSEDSTVMDNINVFPQRCKESGCHLWSRASSNVPDHEMVHILS